MSEFEVTYQPVAEDQLADAWLTAPDRNAVTTAQATIDRLLAADPHGHGRHLTEGLFTLHVPPLQVYFTVDDERKHVWVEAVRTNP